MSSKSWHPLLCKERTEIFFPIPARLKVSNTVRLTHYLLCDRRNWDGVYYIGWQFLCGILLKCFWANIFLRITNKAPTMESVFSSFLKTPSSLLQRETAGGACEARVTWHFWVAFHHWAREGSAAAEHRRTIPHGCLPFLATLAGRLCRCWFRGLNMSSPLCHLPSLALGRII